MNPQLRDEILKNLDARLAADGFKRPRRSQEWRKVVAEGEVFKIHLGFGLVNYAGSCHARSSSRNRSTGRPTTLL